MSYRECPYCGDVSAAGVVFLAMAGSGAALDPGEVCDCTGDEDQDDDPKK